MEPRVIAHPGGRLQRLVFKAAWQTRVSPAQSAASSKNREEHEVADKPANSEVDWILKAMVTVAASDGQLDSRETGLIQQVYQDQSGRSLTADEVAKAAEANAKGDTIAEFGAAAKVLDQAAKEEVIRAAYLVLLADDRIAGEERKKLKDIAAALQISEIHFGAILEDLAIWLAKARS
jgi:tellurite resistance protein